MTFPSIRLEGTILSSDLLDAIERGDKNGQEPRDFGFESGTKVKDEIASTWATAKALWTAYQSRLSNLREGSTGTTETRNLFISPLFSLLGYSPELTEAETLNGKSYAISHRDNTRDGFPIQIVGPFAPEVSITPDRSTLDLKIKGQARMSPHALVQEYLNLTEHLYGLVTNGHKIRLLRDSSRLIKLSFLEFDFERMFGEELFADFALLYRLLHASRMPANRQDASRSLIERYHQDALESGSRIRDGLASAVAFAMQTIATGLLAHEKNEELRTTVASDQAHAQVLHQNLLRWVYRTLFLLVIEERGLHHNPDATLRQRRIYQDYYSLQRLRRLADRPQLADRRYSDLWGSMHQTLCLYEDGGKGSPLGIAPLGSFLFREEGLKALFQYQLDNSTLLKALNRLSIFQHPDTKNYMRVNYAALDVEEFGSIYESLLELRPRIIPDGEKSTFHYAQLAGNERKTTGSYYTPDSLVQQLIYTALDPVLDKRLADAKTPAEKEIALLSLKVCDPAVGSGHFLIAAAHRLSRRLAEIRAGDEALSLDVQRHALRDVVSHCLYGVDINPLSVELCKVSLWMLAMEPGMPLSFLDHHIQCGNALLGATPERLTSGIPDAAFKPIEGDDAEYCTKFKKANKDEAKLSAQIGDLFDREMKPWERLGNLPSTIAKLDTLPDDTSEAVRKKTETYENAVRSADYLNARFLHDAWCAAFVWKKCIPETGGFDYPITNGELSKIERNPYNCPPWMREETQRLARRYKFFHWHLAFPEVFGITDSGFDVILGNPPWDRLKLDPTEWFSYRAPDIATEVDNDKRMELIAELQTSNPTLSLEFKNAVRDFEAESLLLRDSGVLSRGTKGEADLSTAFAELGSLSTSSMGRVGMVVSGTTITGKSSVPLLNHWTSNDQLLSAWEFINTDRLFKIDSRQRYALITITALGKSKQTAVAFDLTNPSEIPNENDALYYTEEEIELLSPNTGQFPKLGDKRTKELLVRMAKAGIPMKAAGKNPFGFETAFIFEEAKSRRFFATEKDKGRISVLEGKSFHQFDHRYANYERCTAHELEKNSPRETLASDLADPTYYCSVGPRLFADQEETMRRFRAKFNRNFVFTAREVSNSTNERTVIAGIIPPIAILHSAWTFDFQKLNIQKACWIYANFNSMAFDFTARQKVTTSHLSKYVWEQLPVLDPRSIASDILASVFSYTIELTYTAWDLEPFAVDCGYDGPPFKWDEDRRFQLRCELDAIFFHLYLPSDDSGAWKPARIADGAMRDETEVDLSALKAHFPTPRHAVAYIMDTFPIVRKKDIKATTELSCSGDVIKKGFYRTKKRILDLYDQMLLTRHEGKDWRSPLEITPASFCGAHPPRVPVSTTRTVYTEDEKLWLHFIRQFLLQARHQANLELLVETWNLFSNPINLIEQQADQLGTKELLSWKNEAMSVVPKRGFHYFVAGLHASGLIQVDRDTHHIILPEESSLRRLDKDEWINYEVSQALAILANRPDITGLLSGESEHSEVVEIISYFAA